MDMSQILAELRQEWERLEEAIRSLERSPIGGRRPPVAAGAALEVPTKLPADCVQKATPRRI
jgi:hypothetical protein